MAELGTGVELDSGPDSMSQEGSTSMVAIDALGGAGVTAVGLGAGVVTRGATGRGAAGRGTTGAAFAPGFERSSLAILQDTRPSPNVPVDVCECSSSLSLCCIVAT
ncbi:MAG: hypothetical protein U0165_14040 [Polyangiaceae bacterium]